MYNNQFLCCPYYMIQGASTSFNSKWRNTSIKFAPVNGTVTRIEDFYTSENDTATGCFKLMSLETIDMGPVNFVISPETYFVNHEMIEVGDKITGFFNANAPVPLIYPPQYSALVIAKYTDNQNVTVDFFNNQLLSSDGNLKLNIAPSTAITLRNDQPFKKYPRNKYLIVIYGPTTKSIPAQTTPYKIIVLC